MFSTFIWAAGTATPNCCSMFGERLRGKDRLPLVAGLVQADDQPVTDDRGRS